MENNIKFTNHYEDKTFIELFEEVVEENPQAIAVEFKEQKLTYQELSSKSNKLARYLQKLGVKRETYVGISLERSLEMIVAILAILKAGGAYIPLDPNYPKERLSFIINDSKLSVLVTSTSLEYLFEETTKKIILDKEEENIEKESKNSLNIKPFTKNAAYIIYTSGSTGRPKGVVVEHSNLSNLARILVKAFYVKPKNKVLQFASFSFDAACCEIFTSLLSGARLCLVEKESLLPPEPLLKTLEELEITNVILPPAVLKNLPKKELPKLKVIVNAGEACSLDIVKDWANERYFLNGYGPTETTICATVARCFEDKNITIGYPLDEVEVYILNNKLDKVELGEIGEIYISGKGVSRGYLNNPALSAECFIPNPFSVEIGTRLYKTGDLARYQIDGQIEFLGRADTQIKLRGFRIELGEIETTLSSHPLVKNAIVVVKENLSKEKTLLAYLVTKEKINISTQELKNFLREYLPEHMVPSAFLQVDSLPLTPNGKVDRKTIMALELYKGGLKKLPNNEIENKLVEIWSEVLKLDKVGTNEDFFELGGHSLLVTQTLVRIREHFNVELPFRSIFEHPIISSLAKKIEELSSKLSKKASLSLFLEPKIKKEFLPLSFSQNRIWFINKLDPGNLAYNAQATLHFYGLLNIEVLEKCFNEIILRHEIFRTTFPVINQQAIQQIHPFEKITIPLIKLDNLSEADRNKEIEKIINKEIRHNFDLRKLYLIRWTLLKLSEKEYILIHVEHHMLHDGWSFNVLLNELIELYKAFINGKESPFSNLPIQFSDFAYYQHKWLESEHAKKQIIFWKKYLKNAPSLLKLNYDRPRPAVQTFRGDALRCELPLELAQELRQLSHKENTTLFMTMFAAFSVLLYRYSNQNDICVGSGIANRRWDKTEHLIGMIINTIVLRINLSGDLTFEELLKRVREITLECYENQELPFEKVVEILNPERSLNYSPIYQVLFSFHDAPLPKLKFENLELKLNVALNNGSSKFDLNIVVVPYLEQSVGFSSEIGNSSIGLIWEYNSDLFDRTTIDRMLKHYLTLLRAIVVKYKTPISKLDLLTEFEEKEILLNWNRTKFEYTENITVNGLFELQAEKTPNKIAVVFKEKRLTFKELNEKANRVARKLVKLGAKPETLIGICFERSINLIIILLAVLKSGAAYVPLDPNYPNERLSFMLEDSKLSLLITNNKLAEKFSNNSVRKLFINEDDYNLKDFDNESNENPQTNLLEENLAYVIYTSGSTGKPKGVEVIHKALVNFLFAMKRKLEVTSDDILLSITSLSFDIAALEIYLPLIIGAELVIASNEIVVDGKMLLMELQRSNISIAQATPSTWQMLLTSGLKADIKLKILCGGEAMSNSLAEKLSNLGNDVWNMYGPTETTIWSSMAQIKQGDEKITVGYPIDNTEFYILDNYLTPTPIGVMGNLYIGGDGLARGYRNRPDLTAEKFIPNPFSEKPGTRLYNTGDLCRYLADGRVEVLGRLDNQIKIRGYRIELGEIESAILENRKVKEAIVIVKGDNELNKSLVAYLITEQNKITSQQIQQKLKSKLPNYMVPSSYIFLSAFPLLPNGKIDKTKLSNIAIEATNLELLKGFVLPRNTLEEKIAKIWSQTLKQEKIGVYDNFFDLGGHSLLALQVIFQIQQNFNVEISVRDIFESLNIATLAEKIQSYLDKDRAKFIAIEKTNKNNEIPLSFSQERLWLLNQFEPNSPAYNLAIALKLSGNLNIKALEESINKLVNKHEILRTKFENTVERVIQVVLPSLTIPLEIIDLEFLQSESEKKQRALELINHKSAEIFSLAIPPLLRVLIIKLSKYENIFYFNMHHIISDEWSISLFFKEISCFYKDFILERESSLVPLPLQYGDYSTWQRNKLSKEVLEKNFIYWKEKLENSNPYITFPSNFPRPKVQTYKGARYKIALDQKIKEKLVAFSKKQNVTLFMTMLASFKLLIYKYTGEKDIVLGTPVTTRTHSDLEELIGFFVNTIALRTKFSDEMSFISLLEKVKQSCLSAYSHQDMPFEKLVEFLNPVRHLSFTPVFQIMFMFQEHLFERLDLPNISVSKINIEYKTAKFDMILRINQMKEGLEIDFEYNTDLFKEETIQQIATDYFQQIGSIINKPIELLLSEKITKYLVNKTDLESNKTDLRSEINNTITKYTKDKTIVGLFEDIVEKFPDSIVIEFESEKISYKELNEKTNQLAYYLRKKINVREEELIGVYIERCLEMVVAFLAILKIGGGYLPLDINYPKERIDYIIKDGKVRFILTKRNIEKNITDKEVQVIYLDEYKTEIEKEPKKNFINRIGTENIAYVMYTSGSTGNAKGVEVLNKGVVRLVKNTNYIKISPKDVFLQYAPITFDASTFEIWGALLNGAKLVIPSADKFSLEGLGKKIKDSKTTILWLTSALFQQMVEENIESFSEVKYLLAGGDVLPVSQVKKLLLHLPNLILINGYGPTENTTFTCCHVIKRGEVIGKCVPIGRPISNTSVYILDKDYKIVPVGAIGELFTGGDGLARGYLDKADLTAEKFIANPFSKKGGERLYKTGDLARYLEDGNIEFIGRNDFQVKIRGFRVELEEIESVLNSHKNIKQSIVVAKEDKTNNKYLVAYSIANDVNNPPSDIEITRFLTNKLPFHMIPSVFIFLKDYPKNLNGKIDRQALILLVDDNIESRNFIEPENNIEKLISSLWSEILNLSRVSRLDNFFQLGGHSLVATKIISRLKREKNIELTLRDIFENPTIALLSSVIAEKNKNICEGVEKFITNQVHSTNSSEEISKKINNLSDEEVNKWLDKLSGF